jgi:glycerate kinase
VKVLLIPDKFKGTLTALAAAQAIARGWKKARPNDEVELLPMSDGGDGFGEIISRLLKAKTQTVKTIDAAHRPLRALWWWEPKTKTAIIESANIIGLAQLPPGKFHPFDLDTFGLGAALLAAASKGAKRCLIGIGGSATNDGGFGLARALGWQFLASQNEAIEHWTDLASLSRVRAPRRSHWFDELVVAVDVQNPLLGRRGCTRVYGPQKGLRHADFPLAEQCLKRLAQVNASPLDCAHEPGAGAAGGLGFGLRCFAGARLEPGFALFAHFAHLTERLNSADLVITGEGAIDRQTLMGKGVGELARLCKKLKVPCLGLAGAVEDAAKARHLFTETYALTPDFVSREKAMTETADCLEQLAAQAAEKNSRAEAL